MPYTPGPFSAEHMYVQWGGKLPGGEEWSNGLRLRGSNPIFPAADAQSLLPGLVTALSAYHARATTLVHASAKLSYVKCNAIGVDGHYSSQITYETVVADVAGGSTSQCPPNQVTMVVSWLTAFSRGPGHRGRMYVPLTATNLDTDGSVFAANVTGAKTSANTLLTAINAINPDFKAAVFSRKAGAATSNDITTASVGRILDTQRRRRRSLLELHN